MDILKRVLGISHDVHWGYDRRLRPPLHWRLRHMPIISIVLVIEKRKKRKEKKKNRNDTLKKSFYYYYRKEKLL